MNILASLMGLANKIDDETKALFVEFCKAAVLSGNPNQFVKDALRGALYPQKPPMVDAEVVDVK